MKLGGRWFTRCLAVGLVALLRCLYGTCRIEAIEQEPGTTPYREPGADQPERYLYCIWHDVLLMAIFSGRPCQMAGLVSRHQDGSYLADSMQLVGITPIRGSSKRGGTQALKQCLDAAQKYHVSITPDGPRGPRHEVKEGIVFMASVSGRRIVPVSASCKRYWRIQGSWTDMLIPKPFTKILIETGEPLSVPADLSREQLRDYVYQLESRMHELTQRVEQKMHPQKTFPLEQAIRHNEQQQEAA